MQHGGLSRDGEQEFAATDPATEVAIKPAAKHTVELPVSEVCPSYLYSSIIDEIDSPDHPKGFSSGL